eukprot:m.343369 g.343369  ORF g.343369 m.343369 type:complete len:109 (-) comp20631_c0_seq10:1146-1472(-)
MSHVHTEHVIQPPKGCPVANPSGVCLASHKTSRHAKEYRVSTLVNPMPPSHSMHFDDDSSATRDAFSFAMAASFWNGSPASFMRAALYTSSRAASISIATSAYCISMP